MLQALLTSALLPTAPPAYATSLMPQVHGCGPVQQGRAERGQDCVCAATGHHQLQLGLRLSRHSRHSTRNAPTQHAARTLKTQRRCASHVQCVQRPCSSPQGSRLMSTQAQHGQHGLAWSPPQQAWHLYAMLAGRPASLACGAAWSKNRIPTLCGPLYSPPPPPRTPYSLTLKPRDTQQPGTNSRGARSSTSSYPNPTSKQATGHPTPWLVPGASPFGAAPSCVVASCT